MGTKTENVKWVDGLRGLASFLVVVTHLARAFDTSLFAPAPAADVPARVLQWPFVRVLIQGRIGVSIFSLVTGYVCALKPLRQARAGNFEAALSGIAKSALRRVPRLVLPTTIITLISWGLCQCGAFLIAKKTDSEWLSFTSPDVTMYFFEAFFNVVHAFVNVWVYGPNIYDLNQWTMQPLLKGSMLVYIVLFATLYIKPRFRMMTCWMLWFYFYYGRDPSFGMQFFYGVFLADLQTNFASQTPIKNSWARNLFSPFLIIAGLFLASYPEQHAEYAPWSQHLSVIATYLMPEQDYDAPRYFTAFGVTLIALGIHLSPRARDFLSNKYLLWLGKNSFAVYLLHGTLIRTVLAWMLYGITLPVDVKNEDGSMTAGPKLTMKGPLVQAFWVPIWFCLVYSLAHLWTSHVDPLCARLSEQLVSWVQLEEEEKVVLLK